MPFAQLYILEGRTEEQKRALIEKVTAAIVEAVAAPKENSSISKRRWIPHRSTASLVSDIPAGQRMAHRTKTTRIRMRPNASPLFITVSSKTSANCASA